MTEMLPEVYLCVKATTRLQAPISFDSDARDVAAGCRLWGTNDADRFALEAALKARECGTIGAITCVAVGPAEANKALYYCLAAGANRAIRVPVPAALLFEPSVIGALLAAAIRDLGGRLVFTAQRSNDGESGIVPVYLAHALGAAYLSNVTDFHYDGSVVEIRRKIERGNRQVWRSRLPAVIAFDRSGASLRYVAVSALASARRHKIQELTAPLLGISLPQLARPVRLERLMVARVRTKKLLEASSSQSVSERMLAIAAGGSTKRATTILEGARDTIAADAVDYLRRRRLLPGQDS